MNDLFGIFVAALMLATGVMWAFFTDKCYRKVTPEQADRDRRRFKNLGFFLLPAGLILLVYYIAGGGFNVLGTASRQQARRVIRECMAATEALDKSPPGFARAEEFIRRIRAIDTHGAPQDLVDALHADADALARGLAAAHDGKDTKELDEQAAAAKERLAKLIRKYW
jgi:hypothetical protein